jgi:hypothetical protein
VKEFGIQEVLGAQERQERRGQRACIELVSARFAANVLTM